VSLINQNQTSLNTAIVAGHICLDIIPDLRQGAQDLRNLLSPGRLLEIGAALLSTGGAVPNTGLALHRLGTPTRLMGKIGDDAFGTIVRRLLDDAGAGLSGNMIVAPGEHTSYSIVLSPAGIDRTFLHHSGTNDTFGPADVPAERLAGAAVFHFGYPPLMKRLYCDGGVGLASLFRLAQEQGSATSLDMVQFDLRSEAARADWPGWLRRVLPNVDLFLPSIDEILLMLGDDRMFDAETLSRASDNLLAMGPAVVALKLGDEGLYLRTTSDATRLARVGGLGLIDAPNWAARELLAPCFAVDVAGTTGAGDCTIAGFLAAVLRRLKVEPAMTAAVAAGAHCVERPDAVSGVPTWDALQRRIAAGWARRPTTIPLPGWTWNAERSIAYGRYDARRRELRAEP
jgi:sugar/nucleoside kinase (ribokinase family)